MKDRTGIRKTTTTIVRRISDIVHSFWYLYVDLLSNSHSSNFLIEVSQFINIR